MRLVRCWRRAFGLVQCWFPHTLDHAKRNQRVTNDGPPSRLEFLTVDEQDIIAALVAEAVASVGDLQVFRANREKVNHVDHGTQMTNYQ